VRTVTLLGYADLVFMSSEWVTAADAVRMGIAWR
jgi:hypothetical protein